MLTKFYLYPLLLLSVFVNLCHAEIPTTLTDTIKQGSGVINILTDTSSAELQSYLEAGTLYLGADLNEDASGVESSTSVGVAIKDMTLVIETTQGSFSFSEFYTNTSAMIVEQGAASADEFHTLFGGAGGSQITGGSGYDLSAFDDVIEIQNISIEGDILSANLQVTFLDTANLGVNESFFDYSAGFEQFALISGGDASILDSADIGINETTPETISYSLSAPTGTPEPYWLLFLGIFILLIFKMGPSTLMLPGKGQHHASGV